MEPLLHSIVVYGVTIITKEDKINFALDENKQFAISNAKTFQGTLLCAVLWCVWS